MVAATVLAGGAFYAIIKLGGDRRLQIAALAPVAVIAAVLVGAYAADAQRPAEVAAAAAMLAFIAHVAIMLRASQQEAQTLNAALRMEAGARSAAEAERAAKSEFLAMVSHEIRTPANAVSVSAHLLDSAGLAPAQRRYLEVLVQAAESLTGMVNDLLDFSRISAGRLRLERVAFDLREKLVAAAELSRGYAEQKGLSYEIRLDDDLPEHVWGDPLRLQQIIINLLSNAVKFTQSGGVSLHARWVRDGRLVATVSDTGPGMDEATLQAVFRRYHQSDAAAARRLGGVGLGLAISRDLAGMMGGALTARSVPAHGSTFTLEAPFALAQAAPLQRSLHGDPQTLAGTKVLAADDNEVNRMVLAALLDRAECRTTLTADGDEAVRAAAMRRFDVILLDMMMPVMDGLQAAAAIRRSGLNRDTPIIALTAQALPETEQAWRALGADFLTKPIDPDTLRARIVGARRRAADQADDARRPTLESA